MRGKQLRLSRIVVWLVAANTGAVAAHGESSGQSSAFMSFDTDRDGYISHDEAQRIRHFDRALVDADDNRNGRLDPDEFIKAQSVHERLQVGQYVVDSVITARVKAALLKEPRLSGSEIEVETHEGIVQLSGLVDNNEQVKRAAEIAAGVEGVTAVRNHLLVKKLGDMKQSAEPGDQT